VTREAMRKSYHEQRLIAFERLHRQVVVLVYTDRRRGPHIISLRKAEKYEARYYIKEAKNFPWPKSLTPTTRGGPRKCSGRPRAGKAAARNDHRQRSLRRFVWMLT
jgi:hypothetical protein